MRQESAGKRLVYRDRARSRRVEVDFIVDGDRVDLIPAEDELVLADRIRRVALDPSLGADELARRALGPLLEGLELAEVEEGTTEIERTVLHEMRKTPISLRDGSYEKGYAEGMVLCLDLREFSSFARDFPREQVRGFLERYTQELLAGLNAYDVSYYKLLGDGALAIWDAPARADLDGVLEFFGILRSIVAEVRSEFGYRGNVAGAVTLDELYKYEIHAETSGLKYRDYIGYGINYAVRLQAMASAGGLLGARRLVERFALDAPRLPDEAKPDRCGVKGITDEDYEDVYVLAERETR